MAEKEMIKRGGGVLLKIEEKQRTVYKEKAMLKLKKNNMIDCFMLEARLQTVFFGLLLRPKMRL